MEHFTNYNESMLLLIFGTLLTIIGYLINMHLKELMRKIDKIEEFMQQHVQRSSRDISELKERYHNIVNDHITPLQLKVIKLEEKHREL